LTSTLSVPKVADFLIDYMLALPGNENVQSINPLIAETNDGFLNDIRSRPISRDDVFSAVKSASEGPVQEGTVGAGTGTVAFGWKGGIGTSSRRLPVSLGGFTLGVLIQSNFGGILSVDGVPVGIELGKFYLKDALNLANTESGIYNRNFADGSVIIVIATDAPLDYRQLKRLAERSMAGLARTGSSMTNGSGDYAIAFSTKNRISSVDALRNVQVVGNDAMSPLFQAVIEASEEAVLNSLFRATTVVGKDKHTSEAVPIDKIKELLRKYGKTK
ncbi:MAG: P1 family peptidase, partial [Pyrinomonadaceae bacterium]